MTEAQFTVVIAAAISGITALLTYLTKHEESEERAESTHWHYMQEIVKRLERENAELRRLLQDRQSDRKGQDGEI